MKKLGTLALAWCLVLALGGCGAETAVDSSMIADRVYTYEEDGFGGSFGIVIHEDGTFTYYEGLLSSYIGAGEWTLEGDTLTLSDQSFVNRFTVEAEALVFREADSDNFMYVKVPDGGRFLGRAQES